MFCPICRMEHRDGFTWCAVCDVALVDALLPEKEAEYSTLALVSEGDSDSAAMDLALLKSAGIESWTRDEEVHALFPSTGLSQVLVREEDEKEARKTLDIMKASVRKGHVNRHSTASRSQGASDADGRIASGDHAKNKRMPGTKQHETPAKCHQDNGSRRQGNRV